VPRPVVPPPLGERPGGPPRVAAPRGGGTDRGAGRIRVLRACTVGGVPAVPDLPRPGSRPAADRTAGGPYRDRVRRGGAAVGGAGGRAAVPDRVSGVRAGHAGRVAH